MSATSQQTVPEQFLGFFDDAATFPPGLAPVEQAVADHVERRSSPNVAAVGPAVLALADLQRAREIADAFDLTGGPVEVSVVTPAGALAEALEAVDEVRPQLQVVAIELKTDPQDREVMAEQIAEAAAVQDIPIFVELTAAQVADGALDLLVGTGLALKYRTGGIEAHLFPTPQELGDVLAKAVAAGVPFKLTAGLHEAIRYTNKATGFHHHGFLNIALATQAARAHESPERVAGWLAETDPGVLAAAAADSDGSWRKSFRSFGTCSVSEPADSLRRLDLFPARPGRHSPDLTTTQEHQLTTAAARFGTTGFGAENLPYASFSVAGGDRRLGVRLGNLVIAVAALDAQVGTPRLDDATRDAISGPDLDGLLAAGHTTWQPLRTWLQEVVTTDGLDGAVESAATPVADVELHMPFTVADYVDYYASEHHASNIGRMFRPDQDPLLPNWKHLPVGYHGRAGTVIASGTDIPRPKGLRPEQGGTPSFGPSRRLDIEAELGFVLGGSAPQGEVSVASAGAEHVFGVVIFNDWSARDIQGYEYVPLGPYLGKSFASSISMWVVPFDALTDARVEPPTREHELAPYLDDSASGPWGLDITMEVEIDGQVVSHPPARTLYWTAPQMVAHMTVNGASLRPGDFFGSGTVSGTEVDQRGSFMELSWGGKEPLTLASGHEQAFLEDGQTVTLRGTAPGANGSVIDFGECVGTILPAI